MMGESSSQIALSPGELLTIYSATAAVLKDNGGLIPAIMMRQMESACIKIEIALEMPPEMRIVSRMLKAG